MPLNVYLVNTKLQLKNINVFIICPTKYQNKSLQNVPLNLVSSVLSEDYSQNKANPC